MVPFPQEYEFIELFETEPTKLDEVVPFFYNNKTYKLCRPNGNLFFEIDLVVTGLESRGKKTEF